MRLEPATVGSFASFADLGLWNGSGEWCRSWCKHVYSRVWWLLGHSQTGIRYPNMGVVIHRKWWYDYHPHNGDMTRKNHVEHRIFLGLYGFRSWTYPVISADNWNSVFSCGTLQPDLVSHHKPSTIINPVELVVSDEPWVSLEFLH